MTVSKLIPETFRTVQEEFYLLGGSVLLGIPSGILFDVFRYLRQIFPHHFLTVMLEDIFFLLLSALLLLCYSSAFARGEFRLYFVIGWLNGFILYFCTAGNFFFHILKHSALFFNKIKNIFVKRAKK